MNNIETNKAIQLKCVAQVGIVLIVMLATLTLTFFSSEIYMSVYPHTPFRYDSAGIQLIAPGLLIFPAFLLLGNLAIIFNCWLTLSKYVVTLPFIAAAATVLPFLAIIFDIPVLSGIINSNILLFCYGIVTGILLFVYIVFIIFKYIRSIIFQTDKTNTLRK